MQKKRLTHLIKLGHFPVSKNKLGHSFGKCKHTNMVTSVLTCCIPGFKILKFTIIYGRCK